MYQHALKTAGAITTNGVGTAFANPYPGNPATAYISASAATGTNRRLGVYFEGRLNNSATWFPLVQGAASLIVSSTITTTASGHSGVTTFGGSVVQIPACPANIRPRYSLGGGGSVQVSFNFTIDLHISED